MKNLKRALSFALASVMLIGMMVVGAGAAVDFSDGADIDHKTAVDTLVTLNVINGKGDGSYFAPTDIVTREEMAKMITVALNGGKAPVLGTLVNPSYTDIKGTWSEANIEYCSNLGIIAGRGDGKFGPTDPVTGTEAAKMLLVAMGWDPTIFKFTGNEWAMNVNVEANKVKLYEDMDDVNVNAGLTRDDAAQLIFNAITSHIMVKNPSMEITGGEITWEYGLSTTRSILTEKYGAVMVEGVVLANEYVTLGATAAHEKAGETVVAVTNGDEIADIAAETGLDLTIGASNTFKVSTGKDEIGKAVFFFVKPAKNSTSTVKATVVGGANLGDNDIVTKNTNWTATKFADTMDDAGLKTTMPATYYVNGISQGNAWDVKDAENVKGYPTQFIDNDLDGDVDYVLVEKIDFSKVVTYTTKDDGAITLTGVTKYDGDETVGFADVAKGDYVLYSEVGGRLYVEKAEKLTGILTDYSKQNYASTAADSALWIDSVKYNNSGAQRNGLFGDPKDHTALNLDKTATIYFDACGNIVALDGTQSNKYALATYFAANSYTADSIVKGDRAQVYFEDGTNSAKVVDSTTAGNLTNVDEVEEAYLAAYSYNDDDELVLDATGKQTFTADANNDKIAYTSGNVLVNIADNGTAGNLAANNKNAYMTDSTVVYMVTTKDNSAITGTAAAKVKTYVGKDNVPSFSLAYDGSTDTQLFTVSFYVNSKNEITAIAIMAADFDTVTDNFLYIIDVVSSSAKTKTVTAVINGEVKTLTIDSKNTATAIVEENAYEYYVNADGTYKLSTSTKLDSNTVVREKIEKINTNDKTIVVEGVEYKVVSTTDVADIDEEEMIDFDSLQVGDIVTVIHDNDNDKTKLTAKAVYVHEMYDPNNNGLWKIEIDGTKITDVTAVTAGTGYSGSYIVDFAASNYAADLANAIVVSGGSTFKIMGGGSYAEDWTANNTTALEDAWTFVVEVTSENGANVGKYFITINV